MAEEIEGLLEKDIAPTNGRSTDDLTRRERYCAKSHGLELPIEHAIHVHTHDHIPLLHRQRERCTFIINWLPFHLR